MNPTILGVIGPGFLNQVPTLCTKCQPQGSEDIQPTDLEEEEAARTEGASEQPVEDPSKLSK